MTGVVNEFKSGRHAGLLVPLFSIPSRRSWGIGEIGDLQELARWMYDAGLDFVQVLPIFEMAAGQHSPYSAVSAMAIDPIYIAVPAVDDFAALGGERALTDDARNRLEEARAATRIDYNRVRDLKLASLRQAFDRFLDEHWRPDTRRAAAFRQFLNEERWWVDDYALFRALREEHSLQPWWRWSPDLARREAAALAAARERLSQEWLFFAYVQWLADTQWHGMRDAIAPLGVFGDLPFMVGADSADVWSHQHAFRLDATVGAPPDAFSETGQDWGLPVYRWDVLAAENDAWIRARARRNAELFDGYRVDHLVGLYRTYVIPADGGERFFSPDVEDDQLAQGERLMRAFLESGVHVIAEDLGTVPEFVRASLRRLDIPGYKLLRWEREWNEPEHPFRDPLNYQTTSIATTGTHDTETLVEWWESATPRERELVAALPFLRERGVRGDDAICSPATRDAILELLVASSSDLVILPIQDVFGWRDRINVPATVSEHNWCWRLPTWLDEFRAGHEARERAETLRGWVQDARRSRVLFPEIARVRA